MTDRAIFLDRDGTVIEEVGYLHSPEQVSLLDNAVEALARLMDAGFRLVVVTNQSGVARGMFTAADVEAANSRMVELFDKHDVVFDAIYYCPHLEGCDCRKPSGGMVKRAAEELGVDPGKSYVVGDRLSDMGLALNTGARGILVLTGYGKEAIKELERDNGYEPHHIAEDISAAADWILETEG